MPTTRKKTEKFSDASKSLEFFRSLQIFENLLDNELLNFIEASQIKSYKKGEFLYMEGDKAHSFYIICSGWLKLLHLTADGEEVIISMLAKDNIAGESAIFEEGNYANTAQFAEDSEVISIPLFLLKEQIKVNRQLAINMLHSMMKYQREHEMLLEQYLLYTAPQRVGCFILGLCQVHEQKDGVILQLPYEKTVIANSLGMKGPTFSRALNILRNESGIKPALLKGNQGKTGRSFNQ